MIKEEEFYDSKRGCYLSEYLDQLKKISVIICNYAHEKISVIY